MEEERIKLRLNAQLNTIRAHQTSEQRKEQLNGYYQNNREKIIEATKIYYQNNRAKIRLKQNESLLCKICGKTYTRSCKLQHCKSKRHQKCIQLNKSKISTNKKYENLIIKIKQV